MVGMVISYSNYENISRDILFQAYLSSFILLIITVVSDHNQGSLDSLYKTLLKSGFAMCARECLPVAVTVKCGSYDGYYFIFSWQSLL